MRTTTAIIVGSGFGGQCAAIKLRERGVEDFLILERRSFMGGTWIQNTYPGAAVDVQSPLYCFSFEPYPWTRMFAEQPELEEYTEHVIAKHGLREKTELGVTVTGARWDADEAMWHVDTTGGAFRTRILINATGPLSSPVVPDFPGRDTFAGPSFHTNDWEHDVDYTGKRVAVGRKRRKRGAGHPGRAPDVAELHVFQRTPHWVMHRRDHVFSDFERALIRNPHIHQALRTVIYWGLEWRVIGLKYSSTLLKLVAESAARKLLEEQIPDPVLREKLTPSYTIGCKRIILSSTLYPALARDNVTLHDKHDGIAEITESGITTAGGEHVELDAIVYATGYDVLDGMTSYPIHRADGVELRETWPEYPRAYLGTTVPGFPNFFIVTGPNTGIGHTSAIHIIESQMNYIMSCVDALLDGGLESVEVSAKTEADYTEMIHREMEGTVWHSGGCNSWYKQDGKVIAMFPGFSFTFRKLARAMKPELHVLKKRPGAKARKAPKPRGRRSFAWT